MEEKISQNLNFI